MRRRSHEEPESVRLLSVRDAALALQAHSGSRSSKAKDSDAKYGGGKIRRVSLEEQRRWLKHARAHAVSLVVVAGHDRVDLFSTERDYKIAYQPAFEDRDNSFAARGLGAVTLTIQGGRAARYLLRRAAGLGVRSPSGSNEVEQLETVMAQTEAAAKQALELNAAGAYVGSLFAAAVTVSRRVRAETALLDRLATAALRELERPAVERIVEEEYLIWRLRQGSRRTSRPPVRRGGRLRAVGGSSSSFRLRVPAEIYRRAGLL